MSASELQAAININLLREMPEADQATMNELASLAAEQFPGGQCFLLGVAFGIRQQQLAQEAEDCAELKRIMSL